MKRLLLFFLFLAIGSNNSFSQLHFPEESILNDNDSARIKLLKKIKVKEVIMKSFYVKDSSYQYYTTYYDKKGNDTLVYIYYQNGYTVVTRKFNFCGNITEEYYYLYRNSEGKLNLEQTYLYKRNQHGRLDTLYITGTYSQYPAIKIYCYDKNQNLTEKTTLDTNFVMEEFEKYNYDEFGNLIKKLNITFYNMDTNIYFYKYFIIKPNNLEELKYSVKEKFDCIYIKIYDKELRLIEQYQFNFFDSRIHFYKSLSRTYNRKGLMINDVYLRGDEEIARRNYYYNKQGQLIKEEYFKEGIRESKEIYSYNKNGTIKEIFDYNLDDSPKFKNEYFYIFY